MPFPSEHAARQVNPGLFDQFARHSMRGVDGVDLILGIKGDVSDVQSVRFDASRWTPGEAQGWLIAHGFSVSGFEPAKPVTEKEGNQYTVEVTKVVADQMLVFGWLYVCRRPDGTQVVDHSGEVIDVGDLERAAYAYAIDSRDAGLMHSKMGIGKMVCSVVFTPETRQAMGIPDGIVPDGWWVGFKVSDPEVWQKIKSGELKMFSIGGQAERRTVE